MKIIPPISTVRYGVLALSVLALCSCDSLSGMFSPKPKARTTQIKQAKKTYDASAFVSHLSLTKLALENGETVADVDEDLEGLENFTAQKRAKSTSVTLAVLEYQSSVKGTQRAMAPVNVNAGNFAALGDVMARLDPTAHKLKDVVVQSATVSSTPPLKLSGLDAAAVLEALQGRQHAILAGAGKLSALNDARAQLALLRFFTEQRQKEAAYIAADNVKRRLASAVRGESDGEAIDQLSKEYDEQVGKLRQELPY